MDLMTADDAFERYRALVEDNDQAIPLLVYCNEKDEVTALFLSGELQAAFSGGMQEVVHSVLHGMKPQLGPAKWLVFHSESWMHQPMSPEEFARYSSEPWGMSKDVAEGASYNEGLMICGMSMDESYVRVTPFIRNEQKTGVSWGDSMDLPAQGGIPDLMRDFLSA